ncbi:hypothetical protein FIBSPDRAFT_176226 [Athelia psychrophila]|uniref:Uncharacterized protein n=1 Tax=Athelia psychrophila TaxID=1759441 RepID=A0A166ALX9_9AGAM|nr:hypothetical protein FIBSPDRAFT_176226 [Fibularhizoctonia sp. CBS 109695]
MKRTRWGFILICRCVRSYGFIIRARSEPVLQVMSLGNPLYQNTTSSVCEVPVHQLSMLRLGGMPGEAGNAKGRTHGDGRRAVRLVIVDAVLGDVSPGAVIKAVDVNWDHVAEVDQGVEVGDVVRFAVVVPGDYLDDVGPDVVDGLLPAVVPEGVGELDPVAAVEVFELPRGHGLNSKRKSGMSLGVL